MYKSLIDSNPACKLKASVWLTTILCSVLLPNITFAQWTQFGGTDQSFKANSTDLAADWPTEGPRKVWQRELGEGYSSVLADGGRLFTMYRAEDRERVICLDEKTGKTIWEHAYTAVPRKGHGKEYGVGPRSTPLLVDGRLYTIGVAAKMHCLDAKSGEVLWQHDLAAEFKANESFGGYSSSPIEYKDTIITLVGGEGASIVAFNKSDGSVAWKRLSFTNSYATPRIMKIHGQDQLIAFMETEVIAADPNNGKLKWKFPCVNQWKENISFPHLIAENTVLISSAQAGTFGLKINKSDKADGQFSVEQLWHTKKLQLYHGNSILIGNVLYGSTGVTPPHFISALNTKTGKMAWRKRGFGKSNVLFADGHLIILDEDGQLALTTATPQDFVVHSKFQLLDKVSWTVPTVVGKKMYVRDQKNIFALDLS